MTSEDVSFINYFIPAIFVVVGSLSCKEFYKRGYKKGLIDALKSCDQSGVHKWGKWIYFSQAVPFGHKDWEAFTQKRRFKKRICIECSIEEEFKV